MGRVSNNRSTHRIRRAPLDRLNSHASEFSRIPSSDKKKNALSLLIGPPMVPPNCSRRKSLSGLPSEVCAESASRPGGGWPRRCSAASGCPVRNRAPGQRRQPCRTNWSSPVSNQHSDRPTTRSSRPRTPRPGGAHGRRRGRARSPACSPCCRRRRRRRPGRAGTPRRLDGPHEQGEMGASAFRAKAA